MRNKRTLGAHAAIFGALGVLATYGSTAQAAGDPGQGVVLVVIDRSGSMHDKTPCDHDETGKPITVGEACGSKICIRKWECAVMDAKYRIDKLDHTGVRQYYLWSFGTMVSAPTNAQLDWNIKEDGTPLTDTGGNVKAGDVNSSLSMDQAAIKRALDALKPLGPTENDCGTPLAGAYCDAVSKLLGYGGGIGSDLTVLVESDGLENSTPSSAECGGGDSGSAYPYALPSSSDHEDTVPGWVANASTSNFIQTVDGLLSPSWQSYMLDKSITGTVHHPAAPDTQVKFITGAFSHIPPLQNGVTTDITFHNEWVGTAALMMLSLPGEPFTPIVASSTPTAPAGAAFAMLAAAPATPSTNDQFLGFLKGLSQETGGRLLIGSGTMPPAGDPTSGHAIPGDVNNDGCVNLADYNAFKGYYNQKVNPADLNSLAADVTYDGRININDYLDLKNDWGQGCATRPAAIPVLQQSVFGFDYMADWSSDTGAPLTSVGLPKTEGISAISVGGKNFRNLWSIPFSTTNLQGVTSKFAVDVYIPTAQSNKSWLGQVLMYVSIPSAKINNQAIGNFELTGKPLGAYTTATFAIPATVKSAMTTPHPDFSVKIAVNSNDPGYILDNLRFAP